MAAAGSARGTKGNLPTIGAVKLPEPLTPRRAGRLLTSATDTLSADDRRFVTASRKRSSTVATATDLIARFATMVTGKTPAALDGWPREAETSALASFAAGIRRDEDAVRAALTESWSIGQAQGR